VCKTIPALANRRALAVIYPSAVHHGIVHAVVVHTVVKLRAHGPYPGVVELCGFVFLAHAVDLGPEALLQPAYLTEYLLTARHFFFPVAGSSDVGKLVDKRAGSVYELAERWRCPVGDEGLVESDNVRVGARCGESGAE
jgi:hypothetical protein